MQSFPAHPRTSSPGRRGFLAPAALIALVVVLGATALVIDRLWLDNAQVELTSAAEAAALAGARSLATDELLREDVDAETLVNDARSAALRIARENRIAGEAVLLDPAVDGDVRIGRLVQSDEDRTVFLETSHEPTSVVVNAAHSRDRNNPVVRFFDGWTSQPGADVAARAEATVDNRVVGFQPLDSQPVPALPLAILRKDTRNDQTPTWERDIEQRLGSDRFSIDPATGAVIEEPDGIPEIVLVDRGAAPQHSRSNGKDNRGDRKDHRSDETHNSRRAADTSTESRHTDTNSDAGPDGKPHSRRDEDTAAHTAESRGPSPQQTRNAYAFSLNPSSSQTDIARQFQSGWSADDFPEGLDVLRIDRGPLTFTTLDTLGGSVADGLQSAIGEQRLAFLFDEVSVGRGADRVHCVGVVAGRVMSVNPGSRQGCELVFQPTVLTTRTAVLAHETVTQGPPDRFANRYTYKLQLTH